MKLEHLQVSGFRGFADEYNFDLSADVVIINGPNGVGKTSLLDAVLWGLTGLVERLDSEDEGLVSRYSLSGEARVELVLCSDESRIRVVRRYDGKQSLFVEKESKQLTGSAAESALLKVLWPAAIAATKPTVSLSESVTRTIYLQQDQVRSFLEAEDDESRFDIISELVGTGQVRGLVDQMAQSRNAWTRATTQFKAELQQIEKRRKVLQEQVFSMEAGSSAASDVDDRWNQWIQEAVSSLDRPVSARGTRAKAMERVLNELRIAQRGVENRLRWSKELLELAREKPAEVFEHDAKNAEARVAAAERVRREKSERLLAAQRQASMQRQKQVEAEQLRESLATLAQLALRHLGERCPVCTQEYDIDHTESHLLGILRESARVVADEIDVDSSARELGEAEQELVKAQRSLRELEAKRRLYEDWKHRLRRVSSQLSIKETQDNLISFAHRSISAGSEEVGILKDLSDRGELLTVDLARLSELKRLEDYRSQLREVETDYGQLLKEIDLRDTAGQDAKHLHEALRSVSESLVNAELDRIRPLLQQIYSSVDPHPSFRGINVLSRTFRGRGRLWTTVTDEQHLDTGSKPSLVLSSSQLNVLAVVIFLALNLSLPSLSLHTIALDDPLQSLDNINLLGLADLLRRLREKRQVVIATHDERLVRLLERKLRPVSDQQRTIVHEIDGWTRRGPSISVREVQRDHPRLRLVKTG